jgi:ferrous iron transport protein B
MGLTSKSIGKNAAERSIPLEREEGEVLIALAGNPNVGKSTIFNTLTGLHQHTGNWAGKTVSSARGHYTYGGRKYILVDLPGTYSLMSKSAEETAARDFICFQEADKIVVICDATCLEKTLNLVLQILEITSHVVVCVNLMDEARKKKISIDLNLLEERLGVPVVGTTARNKKGMKEFKELMDEGEIHSLEEAEPLVTYCETLERAIGEVSHVISYFHIKKLSARFIAAKLLEGDKRLLASLVEFLEIDLCQQEEVKEVLEMEKRKLKEKGLGEEDIRNELVKGIIQEAEKITHQVVREESDKHQETQRRLDKLLTSRLTGFPIMLLMLGIVFWITIVGANIPSELLGKLGFFLEEQLIRLFQWMHAPWWLTGMLVDGMFRVLFWVVSVMLPPMAIFFPLFTLLEDSGYLPRIAFNLDYHFKKACACGKQSLCMCIEKKCMRNNGNVIFE